MAFTGPLGRTVQLELRELSSIDIGSLGRTFQLELMELSSTDIDSLVWFPPVVVTLDK